MKVPKAPSARPSPRDGERDAARWAARAGGAFLSLSLCLAPACTSDGKPIAGDSPAPAASSPTAAAGTVKIGLAAMISPKETVKFYSQMLEYVGAKAGLRVEMVQRSNYDEMDKLLETGEVEVAFLCSGPYVADHDAFGAELLVAPQSYGQPVYHAYILVAANSPYQSLADLRGRRFAFTDPKSNTGAVVPTYMIGKDFGESPDKFFKEVTYTGSHDKSIESVAKGFTDGASVDSLIYDYATKKDPVFTSMTRILKKSPPFGIPPVVVRKSIEPAVRERLKQAFLTMHEDPKGQAILAGIMVDRFIVPKDEDYNSVREMKRWLDSRAASPGK